MQASGVDQAGVAMSKHEIAAPSNAVIAQRLEATARLLDDQAANLFRVRAYRQAAATVERLGEPAATLCAREGVEGLTALPGIGPSLARAIHIMVRTGQFPMLERLRGEHDAEALLASMPGIGPVLAERLHHQLGIETLEALEIAAHSGRLTKVPGIGAKRLTGIIDALAGRLGRLVTRRPARWDPPVADLLWIDLDYRREAGLGRLPRIAPRRFNPRKARWLPVLHTSHGGRHYTAMYSNTPRAHRLHRTKDWVVIYYDGHDGDGQATVVTEYQGSMKGHRVVRGRELETWHHYHGNFPQATA
jgi:putative hydrolase